MRLARPPPPRRPQCVRVACEPICSVCAVRIQAASDSEEEEDLFVDDVLGSDGCRDAERVLSEMLRKPIYIPPTSAEDLFAAYLKIS